MVRRRRKTGAKSNTSLGLSDRVSEEASPYSAEPSRTARVTVTVDTGLLAFIDDFVQQTADITRSAVFDQALEMWVCWRQEQNDLACYENPGTEQQQQAKSWKDVTDESARRIWYDET